MPRSQPRIPTWSLFIAIATVGCSLTFTAFAFFRTSQPQTAPNQPVTLIVGGVVAELETRTATVADLLREQAVQVDPNDALSVSLDTTLQAGMVITIDRARDVLLIVDGERRTLRTPLVHPQAILDNQTITLNDNDLVWLDGTQTSAEGLRAWPVPVNEIELRRTLTVTIVDEGNTLSHKTSATTVGQALYEADIPVYVMDSVEPGVETRLVNNMEIVVARSKAVTIVSDGLTLETRTQGSTVLDALNDAGIALLGLDYTIPAETEPLHTATTVRVLRVTESIDQQDEQIAYETVFQADSALELDQRQIVQAGVPGVRRISERVRFENGNEVGREPISTEITQPPQNEIVAYGTNIVLRPIDTPQGPRQYWRKLRVYATSYHPAALGGSNITAIGEVVRRGIIGADPDLIPFRTEVFVPGYGTGIIADTGGARSSPYWIDLGYSDDDYRGWSDYVDLYILAPVPAEVDYLLPAWRPMAGLPDN